MKPFSEIFEDKTKYGTKIKTDEYCESGEHIIIDQSQSQIAGYTNLKDGLFTDVPAIIFGDHTRVIKYVDTPFFIGADGVKILKSKLTDANYKYLYYALRSAKIPNTGYNRHFKWLKELQFKYPGNDEQGNVVKVLDKVARIISARQGELQSLDKLIKARFVEMFGDPIMNTRSMPIKAFSNCCIDMHQGINTVADKVEYQLEGYPIIQSKNITRGYLDLEDVRYLNCDDYEKYKEKYNPKPNDLLVCNIGTIGKTLIVTETKEFLIAWNLFLIKIDQAVINHHYIKTLLELINEKHYFDRFLTGGTVKFINKKTMGAIPTMIPPMEQQEQFSSFVEQVDKSKVD